MTSNLEVIRNLRQQINERPEDYALRLVYADALEESGHSDLEQLAQAIRKKKWSYRVYGSANIAGRTNFMDEFYVLEVVRCDMTWWIRCGPDIVKAHPIQRVRITDKYPLGMPKGSMKYRWNSSDARYGWIAILPETCLPDEIINVLIKNGKFEWFSSIRECRLALSDACIEWAKSTSKAPAVS